LINQFLTSKFLPSEAAVAVATRQATLLKQQAVAVVVPVVFLSPIFLYPLDRILLSEVVAVVLKPAVAGQVFTLSRSAAAVAAAVVPISMVAVVAVPVVGAQDSVTGQALAILVAQALARHSKDITVKTTAPERVDLAAVPVRQRRQLHSRTLVGAATSRVPLTPIQ
jgi:hypothetical protein